MARMRGVTVLYRLALFMSHGIKDCKVVMKTELAVRGKPIVFMELWIFLPCFWRLMLRNQM